MFFCLPIRIEQNRSSHTIPLVNPLLIGINLLVFGFFGASARQPYDTIMFDIIGYCFVHVSLWHLLANMWVLWVFGNKLNQRLGNFWYALVYLGTIIVMGIALGYPDRESPPNNFERERADLDELVTWVS